MVNSRRRARDLGDDLEGQSITVLVNQFPELSETFVTDQARGLKARGCGVKILRRRPGPAIEKLQALEAEFEPISWQPVQSRWRRWLRNGKALIRMRPDQAWTLLADDLRGDLIPLVAALQVSGPCDVYHAHFGPQGELMARLRLLGLLNPPLVVSFHGYDLTRVAAGSTPNYRYLKAGADRIVVTTQFMQSKAESLGFATSQIRRLPVGVALEDFAFKPRHWSPGQTLYLLTVARLVPQKAVDRAITAVAALVKRGIQVRYRIIGDGPCRQDLLGLSRELGVEHCVEFLGGVPRDIVQQQLDENHLFLFPCTVSDLGDEEGQGIVLLEAQACGLPILTTQHGGIPETVADGLSARVVRDDQDAITAGLAALLEDHQKWPEMGAYGRAHVARHFTVTQHLDGLQSIYAELIDTPRSRDEH